MCLNCGCGEIDDRHGVDANITASDVRRAARANGQDLARAVENIEASLRRVGDGNYAELGIGAGTTSHAAAEPAARRPTTTD